MQKEFRVEIFISLAGAVQGKVFENCTGEEYTNIYIEEMTGAFVGEVRKAYCDILRDICQKCFINDYFITAQANRICSDIIKKYGTAPEFLWKKFKDYGVFRNPHNNKWYGIIMDVDKNKLTHDTGKTEILNVKIKNDSLTSLLQKDGIYTSYHLNKKNWISIMLDETLTDGSIMKLVKSSYDIVAAEK